MKTYIELIENLLKQDKTTGENHSEAMLHYTRMNLKRLNRWMLKGELTPETIVAIEKINIPQKWTVLTEAWCGDAAHSMAFLWKMSEQNEWIDFEWKLRDENLDLMDQHLTNGGRSIPKLIVSDKDGNDLFDWGPRPTTIQKAFLEMKANNLPFNEMSTALQKLYNQDKGKEIQQEISALVQAHS